MQPDDPRLRRRQYNHLRPTTPCPDASVLEDLVKRPGSLPADQRELFVQHVSLCETCAARGMDIANGGNGDLGDDDTRAMYLRFADTNMMVGGRYRIREPLGRGGMGEVYRAEDTVLDRDVALKLVDIQWLRDSESVLLLREDETKFRDRLLREAQLMARLKHPNLCELLDVAPFGHELAIVMRYIPGTTLRRWLKAAKRSWSEVVGVFLEAGEGLRAAHQAGLVHRDFKPDNVLVGHDGRTVVTDFGLARPVRELARAHEAPIPNEVASESPRSPVQRYKPPPRAPRDEVSLLSTTGVHALVGTRAYFAPEQRARQAQDERADQYSFCFALYEALYGQRPYPTEEPQESGAGFELTEPPANAGVPAWLWLPIRRGLCREPAGRFPSMELLLAELRQGQADLRLRDRPGKLAKRRLATAPRVAAAAVLLIAISAGTWLATATAGKVHCEVPEAPFAGVWDRAVTYQMGAALLSSENPEAEDTFNRVADRLDDYEQAWSETYGQACAARVESQLSADDFRLRQLCLEDQRRSVQALTQIMVEEGADEKVLGNAVKAAWLLAPASHCNEPYKLSGFKALAASECNLTKAAEREQVQLQIKKACAFSDLAKYEKGISAAQSAIRMIESDASYAALMPEALLCLVWNEKGGGAYKDALESVRKAERFAVRYGNAGVYGSLSAQLAWWMAYSGNPQEVLDMVSDVNPYLVPEQASEQYDFAYALAAMGVAKARQGAFEEGQSLLRRSVTLIDGILGPESPQSITLRANLGRMLRDAGRPEAAVTLLEEALDNARSTLTRSHRSIGWMMGIMADAWRKLGRPAEAQAAAEEALAISRSALGPNHPYVAVAEKLLAYLWIDQGEPERARPLLAHSLSIMEGSLGRDSDSAGDVVVGWGRLYLAGRQFSSAIAAFDRAIAALDKDPASAWTRAEAQLSLATALWLSGRDARRAGVLAANARSYFQVHDPAGRFLASTGLLMRQ